MAKKIQYSIVRCKYAGVFMAQVAFRSKDGMRATLKDSRRLWKWVGASSLSQLAMEGVKKPDECKFPIALPRHDVTEIIEVIPVTDRAKASVDGVKVWAQ
jgi:hypothetical protein